MNKKGQDDLSEAVIVILIILASTLFLAYYLIPDDFAFGQSRQIEKNIEADRRLTEFLGLILEVDIDADGENENLTMRDLIVYSHLNDDYSAMKEHGEDYLESIRRRSNSGWNVRLNLMPESSEIRKARISTYDPESSLAPSKNLESIRTTAQVFAYLPIPEQDNYLQIQFFEREGSTK